MMAAVAFDTLKVARRLIDAEMPARQAEMMAEAVVFNVDSLVTKDHLDARLEPLEARINGKFDSLEARIDGKIDSLEAKFEGALGSLEAKFDGKLDALGAQVDGKLEALGARIDGNLKALEANFDGKFRLLYWMMAVVIASTTVPGLYSLLSG